MVAQSADVIIVGGGIVGCSAAWFLSREGRKVVLFEKDAVASHASGFAFGVLLPPLIDDPQDPEHALNEESFRLHKQLGEELPAAGGIDPQLRQQAAVMLALSAREAAQFKNVYQAARGHGRDIRWLSHSELSHIEARVAPDIPGGLYMGDTYELDPYRLVLSMWQAAEKRGARLVNRAVKGIRAATNGGVVVDAGGERVSAASVIIAAGPWSGTLLESVGIRVPVSPLKGQIVRMEAPGPEMRVSLWWHGDYASTKSDGLLWCGTTEEHVGFDERPTSAARDRISRSALRVLPFLSEAKMVKQTACLRPVTPDGLAVIGRAPGMEGVVVATGAGRHGIAVGPGMGRAAADLAQGRAPAFDVSGLGVQRF
jgi:glycine oxidase